MLMTTKIHPTIQDDQLVKDFKAYIDSIYGYNRSVFGYQVEVLLFKYLAEHNYLDYRERYEEIYGSVTSPIENNTHTHKISNADKLIIQEIYNRFNIDDEITFSAICKLMRSECGLKDTRTHKTHINLLVDIGVLEDASLNKYQLYNVLEPKTLKEVK